nr:MAG TPA: fist Copper fist DNA binding domain [Caudoviricetes sp.]
MYSTQRFQCFRCLYGHKNRLAAHFDVTEMFMRECLNHYRLLDI